MNDCIFCNIIDGKASCKKVYESDNLIAFHDLHPKAKVHVLVLPKLHIVSLAQLNTEHAQLISELMLSLKEIALDLGLHTGFRTIINTGKGGGQEVEHLHVHILGNP